MKPKKTRKIKKRVKSKAKNPFDNKPKQKAKCKTKHSWQYQGGECWCLKCGWFLQPGGRITKRP
jgi:hypothetical protein